uniref:GTP-binding protein Rheb n=1 Tax=Xiphophorus maculatus TaxID=8083 RepID=A0A3B5QBM0_XIPMA
MLHSKGCRKPWQPMWMVNMTWSKKSTRQCSQRNDRTARPSASTTRKASLEVEEGAVGKSSLTIQFVEGQFVDSYDPTIENTFNKMVNVKGQDFNLQLVDTAGQDEYSIFPQSHSMDIHGYVLVYSVTSMKSFEVVQVLHDKLLDMVGKIQVPTVLVGNKKDLHMERVIKPEEGKKLADSWGAAFMESSAKENETAVEVFKRIILEMEKADGNAPPEEKKCAVM